MKPAGRACAGSVLVVDDDPDLVEVMSEILTDDGFQVMTASNGLEALHVLDHEPGPCLIL